jgi:Trk K+ transport system NAD-binding subunit
MADANDASTAPAVLVCGLGRVGLQCLKALRGYRVPLRVVDLCLPEALDVEVAVTGDFRDPDTLRRAGVEQCRSIVLVTSDPGANMEGALAARRANPQIRLVLRSEQHNLHTVLSEKLGNVVVYEPNRLSAAAFALAALDSGVLAHFYVENLLFQVIEHTLTAGDPLVGATVDSAHSLGTSVLLHIPKRAAAEDAPGTFYSWRPADVLEAGDRLLILSSERPRRTPTASDDDESWFAQAQSFWARSRSTWRRRRYEGLSRAAALALAGLSVLGVLVFAAVAAFTLGAPKLSISEALRLALMLLSGGHMADVFVNFEALPIGLRWAEVFLTVSGTILTAVLYALLTDRLLTARFALLARRRHPPARDHVIVAGLGATGQRAAQLLRQLERPVLAVEKSGVDAQLMPWLPVIHGDATNVETLARANLATARGFIAGTPDDLLNVELALLASRLNPSCSIVVRTFDPRFSENAAFLLPDAKILCVSTLAATAFAAAALGEHVINLFETNQRSMLVVEYHITPDDTLVRKKLWEIAEGYSVVPVAHQGRGGSQRACMPDDNIRLEPGDRLIVLASAASLEAIERGEMLEKELELTLTELRPYAEAMQVVTTLAQRLDLTLEQARHALAHLPHTLPLRLYPLQGYRTQRLLAANGAAATLQPAGASLVAGGQPSER